MFSFLINKRENIFIAELLFGKSFIKAYRYVENSLSPKLSQVSGCQIRVGF